MFTNVVKKTKKFFGVDTEDYKSKYFYELQRSKELEEKLNFFCGQLTAVLKQVDACGKGGKVNDY